MLPLHLQNRRLSKKLGVLDKDGIHSWLEIPITDQPATSLKKTKNVKKLKKQLQINECIQKKKLYEIGMKAWNNHETSIFTTTNL